MNTKIITGKDLKHFFNSIADEELEKPVFWWGDSCGGKIVGVQLLPEHYYDFGEGAEPGSSYESEYLHPDDISFEKGTIILTEE